MIVLDSSAAIDAALSPGGLLIVLRHDPVAPPVFWSEVVSALHEMVWRQVLEHEIGRDALSRLLAADIERRSPRRLLEDAWRVATELGWAKTYDAEYIALAQLLACRLVTRDARLQRGAGHLVEIIAPTDL